jgi:hypothetical protein
MNERLLKIFDEMLNGMADRMKDVQEVIEKRKAAIHVSQQGIQVVENRLKCAVYEDEQALQDIETLREYLVRLGKNPQVLMAKARDLGEAQGRTKEARRVAEERVTTTKNDLQGKQTGLAVAELEYRELQKQWNEVSELASQERANAAA